jgi:hypothetical protein
MIASAALVRGETEVPPISEPLIGERYFDVPAMIGAPNPGCWLVGDPPGFTPVACSSLAAVPSGDARLGTTSAGYPWWGLLLPGLASLIDAPGAYAYLARGMSALPAVILVAATLVHLRRAGRHDLAAVALFSMTPIAWFSIGVVNPSGATVAGAVAVSAALLTWPNTPWPNTQSPWLLVCGWLAVLLPRRDGPLWATLLVVGLLIATHVELRAVWRNLPRTARWLVAVSAPLPVLNAVSNPGGALNRLLALSPLILVAECLLGRRCRSALQRSSHSRAIVLGIGGLTAAATSIALVSMLPSSADGELFNLVVGETGTHLRQLVGVLGWLDTPVPLTAVIAWWVGVGILAARTLERRWHSLVTATAMVAALILCAWLLELGSGSDYGRYWQGRYSLPLMIGALFALHADSGEPGASASIGSPGAHRRINVMVLSLTTIVGVAAFFEAGRRWAVGLAGTRRPWAWNTWGAPLHPAVLLAVFTAATIVVAWAVTARGDSRVSTPAPTPPPSGTLE